MASGTRQRKIRNRWLLAWSVLFAGLTLGGLYRYAQDPRSFLYRWSVDDHAELIRHHAAANGLEEALVRAVVVAESGGNPYARSSVGATGLMQVMPAAESDVLRDRDYQQGDLKNPDYNLKIGTAYLKSLMERFEQKPELAVAAYHMGASRLRRLQKKHPRLKGLSLIRKKANSKTRAYVLRVMRLYSDQKKRPATQ
ncbi:MAG: lytic transglycosylase domain-containing protein [Phycisphaeraceae bacterium]|nr:lytic transglycosylase domain-containing protein [Phycisphaeraceae bacterium]